MKNRNLNEEIAEFLKIEREIARYKISVLDKKEESPPSKKRIINIEKEFLSIPFELYNFLSVDEVRNAVNLYRESRTLFYRSFPCFKNDIKEDIPKDLYKKQLERKLAYLDKAAKKLLNRIEEINLVQDSDLYFEFLRTEALKNSSSLDIEKRKYDKSSIEELAKIESTIIAKTRGRIQACILSTSLVLSEIYKAYKDVSGDYEETIKLLDDEVYNLHSQIFRYYNQALDMLPELLDNSMGSNRCIFKVKKLKNLCCFENVSIFPKVYEDSYNPSKPQLGNLMYSTRPVFVDSLSRDSIKKTKNKVFGILLQIPRKGNEKMFLLYKNISIANNDMSRIFNDALSNVTCSNEQYFKALLMKPAWEVISEYKTHKSISDTIAYLFGMSAQEFRNSNFDDHKTISFVNYTKPKFKDIDLESQILVAPTRHEEESILEILPKVNSKIDLILKEYTKIATTNC